MNSSISHSDRGRNGGTFLFVTLFTVSSLLAESDPYTWPEYVPTFNYNFRDEFPDIEMPTKDRDDCSGVVGTQSDGWWTVKWGADLNPLVTEAAITPMLERLNEDFAYFRDVMGWPPDKRVQDGYRSAVYLYGSGLCTDNASNTAKGGWQSSVDGYPIVLLSYYPVYSFDPACTYNDRVNQMGAVVHEGIHCILASMPGVKRAAWFHEGGNTWLQQQAAAQQTENYSEMGFLNGCTFLAPFMPIECYSGWLQDGSFGGPSAEGVDMYEGGTQICTWRNYLGGTQYGNAFPTFLGEWLGLGSVPWIWRYCPQRVLEGIADSIGDEQIRRLIMEYRAKQALIDMKKWSDAFRRLLNSYVGSTIKAEWEPYWIDCDPWKATPYAKTEEVDGALVPEERTLPGWSGANQIPLTVEGDLITVDFEPIGENMTCQLCYRAENGTPVYSHPVSTGTCSLKLDLPPVNDVVIAVVCNTDYVYEDDETRKAHFDYRLVPGEGVTGTADIYKKWYDVDLEVPVIHNTLPADDVRQTGSVALRFIAGRLSVTYSLSCGAEVILDLISPSGRLVERISTGYRQPGFHTETVTRGRTVPPGMYLLALHAGNVREVRSVVVSRY